MIWHVDTCGKHLQPLLWGAIMILTDHNDSQSGTSISQPSTTHPTAQLCQTKIMWRIWHRIWHQASCANGSPSLLSPNLSPTSNITYLTCHQKFPIETMCFFDGSCTVSRKLWLPLSPNAPLDVVLFVLTLLRPWKFAISLTTETDNLILGNGSCRPCGKLMWHQFRPRSLRCHYIMNYAPF